MLTLMDVNCDKMIDRSVYSDNVCESMQQSGPLNTLLCDVIVCPKTYSSTTHSKVCTFSSPKEYIL